MKTAHVSMVVVLAAALLLAVRTQGEGARSGSEDFARVEETRKTKVREFLLKGSSAYPELARYLSELTLDSRSHLLVQYFLCNEDDGLNILSKGKPVALSITRDLLARQLEQNKLFLNASTTFGLVYLAQKGDMRDLDVMRRMLAVPVITNNSYLLSEAVGLPYKILQTRVAGTNLLSGMFEKKLYPEYNILSGWSYSTNSLGFLPSVANTGPQAEYVLTTYREIGRRFNIILSGEDTPYSAITNVAPELLTMRVWFDAKGKAVTDTDLSKYGISVPGLGLVSLDSITNAPLAEPLQEPIPALPAKKKVPAVPLIIGVGILAGLFIVVRFLKRR